MRAPTLSYFQVAMRMIKILAMKSFIQVTEVVTSKQNNKLAINFLQEAILL